MVAGKVKKLVFGPLALNVFGLVFRVPKHVFVPAIICLAQLGRLENL